MNIDAVKAERVLHEGNYDPADFERVHDLYLVAFGDVRLANRMRTKAMEYYVEERCNKER